MTDPSDTLATTGQDTSELQRRRWRVLVIASVGVFMAALDTSIVAVALAVIGPDLRLSYSEALWVQASYLLVVTVLVIPVGRLADLRGPFRLYMLGVFVFGVFSVMAAISPGGLFLIGARVLQGVGGALVTTTSAAIVTAVFPPNERGRALGFNVMFATLGLALGPPLGGLIATHLGWRWIFFVNVPVVVAILASGWHLLGAERRDRATQHMGTAAATGKRIDALGAALLGVMLASLFVPLIFSPLWGWASAQTVLFLVAAVVAAAAFVVVEDRVKDPVLDLGLFRRNRVFAAANTAALLFFGATFGVTVFTAVFLEVVQGRSAQQAGLILLVQPAIMTILAPFAGRLSDRVGSRGLAVTGVLIVAAATGQLALVSSSSAMWRFLAGLATLGLGMAFFGAPNLSRVMGAVNRSELGVASGVMSTMRSGGQGLSIAVLGAIAASQLGPTGGRVVLLGKSAGVASAQAFAAGYREAMLAGAGLAIAGAIISLVRERSPERGAASSLG